MAYIREVIITTTSLNGDVKISPLGIHVVSKSEVHIKDDLIEGEYEDKDNENDKKL